MPFRPKNTGTWDVITTMKIEALVIFHTPDALLNNIKKIFLYQNNNCREICKIFDPVNVLLLLVVMWCA